MVVAASTLIAALVVSAGDRLSTPRFTRIVLPNGVVYAVISPGGQRLAYVSEDAQKQSLWVRDTSGVGAGMQLTRPAPGHFYGVSFSPGGEYLYYSFEDAKRLAEATLYRVPAQGGEPQALLAGVPSAPAFSPDGRYLAFKRYDLNYRGSLLIATVLGTEPRVVAASDAPYAFDNYRWSADGKSIYYVEGSRHSSGSAWALMELPLPDGPPRIAMPAQSGALRSANWLNRSEVLALIPDDDSGGSQIWRVGAGKAARRITNGIADYTLINLTEDTRTLLANSVETDDTIWTAPATEEGRTEPVRLSLPPGSYEYPIWMPDGRVVFVGQFNLWLSSADGLERRPLLTARVKASQPVVSADGRSVVFVMHRHAVRNLWQAGIEGGELQQVTTGQFDVSPALSPDGKWVLYVSNLPGHRAICKVPLDKSRPPSELVNSGGLDFAISPDNRLFAYSNDLGELQLRSFDDGSLVRKSIAPADASEIHWSCDGKSLVYVAGSGGSKQVWRQAIAAGAPARPERSLPSDVRWVRWSRDDKQIVYLRREIKVDLALITNFR
jgi:Tol biopolymer transport system component